MRKGGRFTAGGASIAHLWHGVITRYRSRARGVHNPLCCLYTIITVDQEGLEPPRRGL